MNHPKEAKSSPKVSIIILNWNGLEDTIECLESLGGITYPSYEVIVVDNGSAGDDVEALREKFGEYAHIIANDRNYGFAEGNNIGMRYALNSSNPDYLLLLNNDMVVDAQFLTELVKVAESDAEIGIVGPKIYYYDFEGRKDVIWDAGGKIEWWSRWVYQAIGRKDGDLPQYQGITSVDWKTGAAMMVKRCVIEQLSLFNPQYFLGHEDVEYCLKARKHGFKVVYVSAARVWHKVGRSRKGYDPSILDLSAYYHFIRRNFSAPVYVYHLLLLPYLLLRWGISYLVKRRDRETLVIFLSNFKKCATRRH